MKNNINQKENERMRKIKSENIKSKDMVRLILDNLKPINEYLDEIGEESWEYEDLCKDIQEQFCEILDYLNMSTMPYTNHNIFTTDIMNFALWDYLKEELTFEELINKLEQYYNSREI